MDVKDLVPEVYYNKSRDFQLLGRAFTVVFNYMKMATSMVSTNPLGDYSDKKLLDLITTTFGFKSRHNYNDNQLLAMCSSLMYCMKNKGSLESIETAVSVLLRTENIKSTPIIITKFDEDKKTKTVVLYIDSRVKDLNLLTDLFDYILPVGIDYQIIQGVLSELKATTELTVDTDSRVKYKDYNYMETSQHSSKTDTDTPLDGFKRVQQGTMDNSVISPKNKE